MPDAGAISITMAVLVGFAGGVASAMGLGRRLLLRLFPSAKTRAIGFTFGVAAGAATLAPAIYLAIVIGGNFGGAWTEPFFVTTSLGRGAVPVGLAIGIALVLGVVLTTGVAAGLLVGRLVFAFRGSPIR